MTNELPRLNDGSAVLSSRFLVLTIRNSFYGQEDAKLIEKLLAELPGILNWAIDGYKRLQERGHFLTPESSHDAIEELEALASPVVAFVRDRCSLDSRAKITPDKLYSAWRNWCEMTGCKPGTLHIFGRDLKSALPLLCITRPRENGARVRYYQGIELA
jgi:putative DNA primase/helicase